MFRRSKVADGRQVVHVQAGPGTVELPSNSSSSLNSGKGWVSAGGPDGGVAGAAAPQKGGRKANNKGRRQHKHSPSGVQTFENYIPLKFQDLLEQLVADHPTVFSSSSNGSGAGSTAAKFLQLAKQLSLRNHLRLNEEAEPLLGCYCRLDPDVDTETPLAVMDGRFSESHLQQLGAEFEAHLSRLLAKGGFEPVPEALLEEALRSQGAVMGLSVAVPGPEDVYYRLWYRGHRTVTVNRRPWWRLFLKTPIQMAVFQRFALMFRVVTEDLRRLDHTNAWWRRLLRPFRRRRIQVMVAPGSCRPGGGGGAASSKVQPSWTFLKLFKDIDVSDVDMLLPGSVAKFSWFDHVSIWAPILFGVGSAVWKSVHGTLNFHTLQEATTSLLLIVLPLSWGIRAYFAVKAKQALYEAHLNKLYLLHNLNNNAGVISQVVDEANEQEDNEALLAYFFLWRGQQRPQPLDQASLDCLVEDYLNTLVTGIRSSRQAHARPEAAASQRLVTPRSSSSRAPGSTAGPRGPAAAAAAAADDDGAPPEREGSLLQRALSLTQPRQRPVHPDVRIDFEVSDAVQKLVALGLVGQAPGPGGQPLLQAVDLEQALERSHIRHHQLPPPALLGAAGEAPPVVAAAAAVPAWQCHQHPRAAAAVGAADESRALHHGAQQHPLEASAAAAAAGAAGAAGAAWEGAAAAPLPAADGSAQAHPLGVAWGGAAAAATAVAASPIPANVDVDAAGGSQLLQPADLGVAGWGGAGAAAAAAAQATPGWAPQHAATVLHTGSQPLQPSSGQ